MLAAFLTISEGINLRPSTENPQVVQFPIERKRNTLNPVVRDRLRKRGVVKGDLDNKVRKVLCRSEREIYS